MPNKITATIDENHGLEYSIQGSNRCLEPPGEQELAFYFRPSGHVFLGCLPYPVTKRSNKF